MTRKHFKKIAATLQEQRVQFSCDLAYAEFCIAMGHSLREFNRNFSMSKFLEACHKSIYPIQPKDLI